VDAAKERSVPLDVIDIADGAAEEAYVNSLVLVRPDGFVGWRADRLPDDAIGLIDAVRGETFLFDSMAHGPRFQLLA